MGQEIPPDKVDDPPPDQNDRTEDTLVTENDSTNASEDNTRRDIPDEHEVPPRSPRKPNEAPLSPNGRKYKAMYEDMKTRFLEYKTKYQQEMEIYITASRERESLFSKENKILKERLSDLETHHKQVIAEKETTEDEHREEFECMKVNYENAIISKDEVILKQTKAIQECDERLRNKNTGENSNANSALTNVDTPTSVCSSTNCFDDEDQHKFECIRCKKLIHYRCTRLPTYQIAHFLTTNYRRYICINCTKVPEYVADAMKGSSPPSVTVQKNNDNPAVSTDVIYTSETSTPNKQEH